MAEIDTIDALVELEQIKALAKAERGVWKAKGLHGYAKRSAAKHNALALAIHLIQGGMHPDDATFDETYIEE